MGGGGCGAVGRVGVKGEGEPQAREQPGGLKHKSTPETTKPKCPDRLKASVLIPDGYPTFSSKKKKKQAMQRGRTACRTIPSENAPKGCNSETERGLPLPHGTEPIDGQTAAVQIGRLLPSDRRTVSAGLGHSSVWVARFGEKLFPPPPCVSSFFISFSFHLSAVWV